MIKKTFLPFFKRIVSFTFVTSGILVQTTSTKSKSSSLHVSPSNRRCALYLCWPRTNFPSHPTYDRSQTGSDSRVYQLECQTSRKSRSSSITSIEGQLSVDDLVVLHNEPRRQGERERKMSQFHEHRR